MKLYAFFLSTFKFLCVLTTVIMVFILSACSFIFHLYFLRKRGLVGYWTYKYDKNDDQTSIEHQTLNKTTDFVYPELTICFIEPYFKNDSMTNREQTDFNQAYRSYLIGMYEMNETFKNAIYCCFRTYD